MSTALYLTKSASVEDIKQADDRTLQSLYNSYRKEFGQWAKNHYNIDEDVAGEIYQQSFTIFYYNIKESKLQELTSGIKTYLFSIGKNLLRQHFRSSGRFVDVPEYELDDDQMDNGILDQYEQADRKAQIHDLLQTIGEPCKTVLQLFYFQNYSMEAIAQEMNYKSEQVAAKRKFICLQQLRTLIETKTN